MPFDKLRAHSIYCSSADHARAHYAMAVRMGFSQVHVMTDGIAGWTDQGQPVEAADDADGE